MDQFISENINKLDLIIEMLKTSSISYDEFFKLYYMSVHEATINIPDIDELKKALINALVKCTNDTEFRNINLIKNTLINDLDKKRGR